MKRLLMVVFVGTLAGCESEPDDSAAPIRPAVPIVVQPIPHHWTTDEVLDGWTSAGATVGIFGTYAESPRAFRVFQDAVPQVGQLPGFSVYETIDLSSLSDPGVPFGLMLITATSEQLQSITHLENLHVLEIMIEDLSAANLEQIGALSNLRSLAIFHSALAASEPQSIDAGMVHLANLTQLEQLKLVRLDFDAGLQHLTELEQLLALDLYGSKVTDAGLEAVGQLRNLRGLDLTDTAVTDAGIPHLSDLSQLEELVFERTQATAAGVERLRELLPDCDITCTVTYGE